jgi:RND family efflux transporter MFP subunit
MLEPQQAGEPAPNAGLPQEAQQYTPETPTFAGGAIDLFADDDPITSEQEKKPWWRDWRWIIGISALVIAALIGLILNTTMSARAQQVTYQQRALRQGNLVLTVGATGPVQGGAYNATFATSGRVAEIDVNLGQHVDNGQQLAKLDTSALQDALRQAQAQKDQAWWTLQNALWNCDNQKNQPPNCKDAANAAYNSVKGQYQTALNNLNNATLTAPHAGIVSAINGTVGGSSSGGSSTSSTTGGGFIQITDTSTLQVVASVNEADIGNVATGQAATFTTSAYGATVFKGTVSLISPAATTTSNVVTYPVTVNVDMSSLQNKNLLPGMTATITITRARRDNVVLLPATALTFARSSINLTGSSASSNSSAPNLTTQQVRDAIVAGRQMLSALEQQKPEIANDNPQPAFVLQQNGKQWVVKPVVIGLTDGTNYEALAGIAAGDRVVTGQSGGATTTTTSPRLPFGGGGGGGGGGGRGGGTGGDLPSSADQGL